MIITAIVLATVQALTEFLPVSSSGHLLILHSLIKGDLGNNLIFDTILHGGTLVAVVIYFFSDYLKIFKPWFKSVLSFRFTAESGLGWKLIVATIPGAILGYVFSDFIDEIFRWPVWTAVMLIIFGLVLIWAEKFSTEQKNVSELSWSRSVAIGFAQALALIPGVSRSGITITAGLFSGLSKTEAARFSFLLSGPIIAGAFFSQVFKIKWSGLVQAVALEYLLGFIISAVLGYLVIAWFMQLLKKIPLRYFAYYRFILAVLVLIWFS